MKFVRETNLRYRVMKISKELAIVIFQEFLHDQLARARVAGKSMTPKDIHSIIAMTDSKAGVAIETLKKRRREL